MRDPLLHIYLMMHEIYLLEKLTVITVQGQRLTWVTQTLICIKTKHVTSHWNWRSIRYEVGT